MNSFYNIILSDKNCNQSASRPYSGVKPLRLQHWQRINLPRGFEGLNSAVISQSLGNQGCNIGRVLISQADVSGLKVPSCSLDNQGYNLKGCIEHVPHYSGYLCIQIISTGDIVNAAKGPYRTQKHPLNGTEIVKMALFFIFSYSNIYINKNS